MLDKQGNWKLKLCSHSFRIAKSWGIWLRSVVIKSRLFPRGIFWFVCLHCLIPFIFHHKLQAFSYSFALYKTEVDKKQTINWCTLHMYNSLWESFHSLDGTSESSSMIYFYSLRLIELPSSTCVTNSRKVFLFLLFFYPELCNSNLWHFCWQRKNFTFYSGPVIAFIVLLNIIYIIVSNLNPLLHYCTAQRQYRLSCELLFHWLDIVSGSNLISFYAVQHFFIPEIYTFACRRKQVQGVQTVIIIIIIIIVVVVVIIRAISLDPWKNK